MQCKIIILIFFFYGNIAFSFEYTKFPSYTYGYLRNFFLHVTKKLNHSTKRAVPSQIIVPSLDLIPTTANKIKNKKKQKSLMELFLDSILPMSSKKRKKLNNRSLQKFANALHQHEVKINEGLKNMKDLLVVKTDNIRNELNECVSGIDKLKDVAANTRNDVTHIVGNIQTLNNNHTNFVEKVETTLTSINDMYKNIQTQKTERKQRLIDISNNHKLIKEYQDCFKDQHEEIRQEYNKITQLTLDLVALTSQSSKNPKKIRQSSNIATGLALILPK